MYDNTLLASPPPPPEPFLPSQDQKQSKLGIASLVIGLVAVLFACIAFVISFSYGFSLSSNTPSLIDQSSPVVLIAGGLFCCSPILSLVGVGLGIAAVVQKKDKKIFGIIGLVINGLIILSICGLFVLGLIVQSSTTNF
jgi:hypothetical protein